MIFLNSKLMWFLVGMLTAISLLFLADFNSKDFDNPEKIKVQETIDSAKKERVHLEHKRDSINKVIVKHPTKEKRYKDIDEKVTRIIHTATDVQLDSILTNYRYIELSKTSDS